MITVVLLLAAASPASAAVRWVSSPSGNLSCEIADRDSRGSYAFCQSIRRPQSVRMGIDGRLRICRGERCLGDPPVESTAVLGFGRAVRVGRYRCTSRRDGIRCRVIAGGRGFLINRDVIRRIT